MNQFFEQQPRESAKAFAAFSLYLSLGPERSTREVGKQLGKSAGLIERWAAKFDWRNRVAAHATHLAIVEREIPFQLASLERMRLSLRRFLILPELPSTMSCPAPSYLQTSPRG